jgi:hypothetical protein
MVQSHVWNVFTTHPLGDLNIDIIQEMCENFAIIARPLHKLCEKGSIFQWNDECEQAFIRLKDALTSPGRQHNNADALSRRTCFLFYLIYSCIGI